MKGLVQYRDPVCILVVVLVVGLLHLFAFGNQLIADDLWFANALESRTLADYLAFRYTHWSGRLPIETLLVLLPTHPWLWKLINALMWLLLCHAGGRLASVGTGMSVEAATALVLVLFMLISPGIVFTAAGWMTGSINYLWPMALGLFGMIAFVDRKPYGKASRFAFLLASGLAMYNEQVALFLLPATLLLLGIRVARRDWSGWNLAHFGFMVANALVLFCAPGSQNRYLLEQATHFPDFYTLAVMDKLAIGAGLVVTSMIDPLNLLVAAIIVMSGALVWRSPSGRFAKGLVLLALAYLALDYILAMAGPWAETVRRDLYVLQAPGGASASSSRTYLLAAWSAFVIACLAAAAVMSFWRSRSECVAVSTILLLGAASLAVLGFSPTAYASGWRVHFVWQIALLLVAARMMAMFRKQFGPVPTLAMLTGITCAAGYRLVQLLSYAH